MPQRGLTEADREFFRALGDVVFGNPFSARRDQVIVRLAPDAPLGDLTSNREALARVVAPPGLLRCGDGRLATTSFAVEVRGDNLSGLHT